MIQSFLKVSRFKIENLPALRVVDSTKLSFFCFEFRRPREIPNRTVDFLPLRRRDLTPRHVTNQYQSVRIKVKYFGHPVDSYSLTKIWKPLLISADPMTNE